VFLVHTVRGRQSTLSSRLLVDQGTDGSEEEKNSVLRSGFCFSSLLAYLHSTTSHGKEIYSFIYMKPDSSRGKNVFLAIKTKHLEGMR
jgi:hypothetical protein